MAGRKKIDAMLVSARSAARAMACIDKRLKNAALELMARNLLSSRKKIMSANGKDIKRAEGRLSRAMIDRLSLNTSRIEGMAQSLHEIARLNDPVGEMLDFVKRPNGLVIGKMRVPIGVIFIVYEARPNVTSDCIGLCLKSGNSVILRGGSEALESNKAIFEAMDDAARSRGIPRGTLNMVADKDRSIVDYLLKQNRFIDLVIPRGGESLINAVTRVSRIPVIKHYKGVCHTYVDASADLGMAERICLNAKVQRPGVCNAMETLLVHRSIAGRFLPKMIAVYKKYGVEIRGCPVTRKIVAGVKPASELDWYTEYLDLILSVRVVSGTSEAIEHIATYGSQHSDAIVTEDERSAAAFLRCVDSACVYVNASTRFTDGNQFGKGAEIGISTDKLHARGPMGVEELTTYKYIILGNGQIRKQG